jgi:GMP synthase (glutamine-hydrolysing)
MTAKKPVVIVLQSRTASAGRLGDRLVQRGYALDRRYPLEGDVLPASLDDHTGAVVLGGPMSANDDARLPGLRAELDWLPTVLAAGKPFLGVCLGAQLLARVLGARVGPHPDGLAEIGYFPIRPTAAGATWFPPSLSVYHWHQEGFELPQETVLLAEGERFPHQAFCYGPNAIGIQFHPEVTRAILEDWLVRAAARLALPGAQAASMHRWGHDRHDAGIERWLERFLTRWLPDDGVSADSE